MVARCSVELMRSLCLQGAVRGRKCRTTISDTKAEGPLYKTEVIHRRCPWWRLEAVEYAKLEWVDWFNQSAHRDKCRCLHI